ncbi:5-oxoprolinase subunit C family protein [Paenibacillus agricola]|uniref:Biotin-dependent carboxyltransferase n=1 Tax=Paenibacillus agricola TaxID=2716264 RepID=A0ABX0J5Z7_9BACL|nr:biotin-dependent carboxyltransferase family protein [Paenibacillus agricola]NHN30589.1 biotin-dependent carboxyltransferase [Paenibacillus agricola]
MSIQIILAGLLTTIQDKGRFGFQQQGVIVSGAMDSFAFRVANLLVGNDEGAAALEVTLIGPKLRFERDALISICGGQLAPVVDGEPLPLWRPVYVQAGRSLEFGACQAGARAYMAVAGGFDVPLVLGSRSTYLRAGLGGYEGRALQAGDELPLGQPSSLAIAYMHMLCHAKESKTNPLPFGAANWSIGHEIRPAYSKEPTIRIVPGREYAHFTEESRQALVAARFPVSSQSDRMGYRLEGAILNLAEVCEPISEAVSFGTVQVPAGGNPIILMADHQTIGGYPKIAQIATVDLPLLAQLKPGEAVRFRMISQQESEALYLEHEMQTYQLSKAIEIRYKEMR